MGSNKLQLIMAKSVILLSILLASYPFSSSYTINLSLNVETSKQDSSVAPHSPTTGQGLAELDQSYSKLASCGFPEVLKCSGKVEEAAASCLKHPNIQECIAELLGAESECKDCIEAICRALHIP